MQVAEKAYREFLEEKVKLEKELAIIDTLILRNRMEYLNFDEWLVYCKKIDYDYVCDVGSGLVRDFIQTYYNKRFQQITLASILRTNEVYGNPRFKGLNEELMRINFGTVANDW